MLSPKRIPTKRDVLLLKISPQKVLAIACDSSGGVGPRSHDSFKVPAVTVGKYAARTVLLELICIGASVIALTATLAVEYNPTGRQVMAGIKHALRELGLRPPLVLSTEKNFAVDTTGAGITGVGMTDSDSVRIGCSKLDDLVVLIGEPSVGKGVLEAEQRNLIPSLKDIEFVLNSGQVHEMLPVGSSGVIHETAVLAQDSGLRFEPSVDAEELRVSAGPSTALLLTVEPDRVSSLREKLHRPLRVIGSMKRLS